MPIIVGLIVRRMKEKIYAETAQFDVNIGDRLLIETEHGQEVGLVCEREKMVEKVKDALGKVLRKINENDKLRFKENEEKSHQALKSVLQKIEDHELEMKLTCVEYSFDRSKLFIYYTSETRVDFRELIKDLGHILKTRIQMVQIGVRDEAKMVGGIGSCGRRLCCQEFLKDFTSVTIDMAKEQDLSLNTAKLSGLCGRLMCCLAYEHESYKQCKKNLPHVGSKIHTPDGTGTVVSINCLKEEVAVELADQQKKIYKADKLTPK
ncbi:MAG: regulatory iron-sulfur-containing complex subunit RicT [Elusimicrobia bacterium]|nr:regulatory iron-sulfur-containing complex subunit RicT [Elusimicrobiota bacterium]